MLSIGTLLTALSLRRERSDTLLTLVPKVRTVAPQPAAPGIESAMREVAWRMEL